MKENVIGGRLIPAGTGLAYHNTRRKQRLGIDAAEGRELQEGDLVVPGELLDTPGVSQ